MKLKDLTPDKIASTLLENAQFIPLINSEDEDNLLSMPLQADVMPLLPLRDSLLFPGIVIPIVAGREKSIRLLKKASKENLNIAVFAQNNESDEPTIDDLYEFGVQAKVVKIINMPNKVTMGILQGMSRLHLSEIVDTEPYYTARVESFVELVDNEKSFSSTVSKVRRRYVGNMKLRGMPNDLISSLKNISAERIFLNYVAAHLDAPLAEQQKLLECHFYEDRASKVLAMLQEETEFLQVRSEVQDKAKEELDRKQREFFLNQQMQVIQDELGDSSSQDVDELMERAALKSWDDSVRKVFDKELSKLRRMHPQSPDYTVQLNYLDLMLDLPWNEYSADDLSIAHAREVLDRDHYGIEKVKERIIEYISVLALKGDMKSPILCLVGPPGTGKTSLGKSVADALGRKYVRVALGGLHDESEIRGHRRTYIGSMPGRIIQSIKRAGTSNPVFILDEIDKVQTNSVHGDATSALLEVLDPEQNNAFHDNFLDIEYDLSKVLFIATANSLHSIQPALLDRMEIINLSGYILEEKIEIAKRHLLPRQIKEHGFSKSAITIDDAVLTSIINNYTRESGVRKLDKAIAKIVRHRAVEKVAQLDKGAARGRIRRVVREEELTPILGLPIHNSEQAGSRPRVGVVTGLAWTSVGGDILFIECAMMPGKGRLSMTGNLGDVMKESAKLAHIYIKAHADEIGVGAKLLTDKDIHIHVPDGAVPKDGPSAGITLFVAMVSVLTNRAVRSDWAMTGEITLRGNVTPVGGIREKILAAKRAGIKHIMLCEENRREVEEIPEAYLGGLTFHYINEIQEAMPLVLV